MEFRGNYLGGVDMELENSFGSPFLAPPSSHNQAPHEDDENLNVETSDERFLTNKSTVDDKNVAILEKLYTVDDMCKSIESEGIS